MSSFPLHLNLLHPRHMSPCHCVLFLPCVTGASCDPLTLENGSVSGDCDGSLGELWPNCKACWLLVDSACFVGVLCRHALCFLMSAGRLIPIHSHVIRGHLTLLFVPAFASCVVHRNTRHSSSLDAVPSDNPFLTRFTNTITPCVDDNMHV